MSDTVFTKVDYDLSSLIKYIELGEIGLPDIQRPFVWPNAKVRNLFDSIYRGYPIGYLLFWQTGQDEARSIGVDSKQKPPRLMIVDGQQRLTSLYAAIKGVPVVREDYETEKIEIAFSPLLKKFEVADAAIRRDKSYISDISVLWSDETDVFEVVDKYLEGLQTSRSVTDSERKEIRRAIIKLQTFLTYPLTALELAPTVSEEDVAEVFVRINSAGTTLNQADFILTIMSVFWDEGRKELEQFCRESRVPTKGAASPFNHFIDPSPDQLLRVNVGVGFRRARLKYVYSILRGKDLETGEFSTERRIAQFETLKKAQDRTLNIQYWHDFLNCIRTAGFRSKKMISSNNNLIFSYILFLIGRTEFSIDPFELRKVIAQWYFMTAVTGRFTGSPESAMEYDLARLRETTESKAFIGYLKNVCETTLTSDYWDVTLPSNLATSASRSPSLFAYNAALVLLNARVLFSDASVSDLLDPSVQANRSAIERHHLFPKNYLKGLGITSQIETNQIANYAYIEWIDNATIEDRPPSEYVPLLRARFSESDLDRMYHHHALPNNWEEMEYQEFLKVRRELIAGIIREGYVTLVEGPISAEDEQRFDLVSAIDTGESQALEFKSTLRVNLHTGQPDKKMEHAILRTIAGFLNTQGGTLIVGMSDDGTAIGIGVDGFDNEDNMSLHLVNIVKARIGPLVMTSIHHHFEDHDDARVMVVQCPPSSKPVYVKDGNIEKFYVRTGPSTTELSASQTQEYIRERF